MRTLRLALFVLTLASTARAAEPDRKADNPHGPLVDECSMCHKPEAWAPARISPAFDHARFRFPLDGAHAQTNCRACHVSLVFSQALPSCVGCHQDVHQGELGTDCARCHSPRSFIDRTRMTRAHQVTRFPLTGAHTAVDCEDCHRAGSRGILTYVNAPTECESCHQSDYLATTAPNHQVNAFPQSCMECHTPIAWVSTRYPEHDTIFFPINSGVHRGKWASCSDCHINPRNTFDFSCFEGCHAHSNQRKMTDKHAGVDGFEYVPFACYSCHPQGRR